MSTPEVSSSGRVPGQVCDRCRRRKIRCHGDGEDCNPCVIAGAVCVSNFKLKRNRKRKSYYENEAMEQRRPVIPPKVQFSGPSCEREIPEAFSQDELQLRPSGGNSAPARSHLGPNESPTARTTHISNVTGSIGTNIGPAKSHKEPVIGHMGRLVSDDRQVAMFAGSSTGVHFIQQAEQHLQIQHMHDQKFPASAYGLYLHDLWGASAQDFQTALVPSLIQQLPENTIEILESTIDRWTPLYPVVHKPSIIEAYTELLNGQSDGNSMQVVTLYQVLTLLALGSLGHAGSCIQRHLHFLCQSDVYYRMSSTLLNQVFAKPCLQSLQGLVLVQVYLQLTTRYSVASHIGGVATRIAQNLGLHRHSDRFRFDPLETELRRRVWWCQYSLDTFSSAYHGMPRLIRDQDVDTDLPTRVDHDLLSRSQIAFPLPGEATQVDTALLLFKLAKIFGKILEQLYTTTQRRGGVLKITNFQMELDMWERSLPSVFSDDQDAEDDRSSSEASLQMLFLRALHCLATVHIHRPALSFTAADPQFSKSLALCCTASANLIRILSSGLQPLVTGTSDAMLVILLYPLGAHMLWQAALTILFARWKGQPLSEGHEVELLQICVDALHQLHAMTSNGSTNNILECADVLDILREKTYNSNENPPLEIETDQLQWNVWDWPMSSALELSNTLDSIPMDLYI